MSRKQPTKTYVIARDIVIKAGTEVFVHGPHSRKVHYDAATVLTAVTKDTTSEWAMPLDEAVAAGLVCEKAPEDTE